MTKLGIFSDLHLHTHKAFGFPIGLGLNTRSAHCSMVLERVHEIAVEENLDALLFCGDFFEIRDSVSVSLLLLARSIVGEIAEDLPLIMIGGNHDSSTTAKDSPNAIYLFDDIAGVHIADTDTGIPIGEVDIYGLHAQEELKDFQNVNPMRKNILIGHLTLKGTMLGAKHRSPDGVDLTKFKEYLKRNHVNHCYLGDVHYAQIVSPNIRYVGSCIQKNFGEQDYPTGVLEVEISNNLWAHTFITLSGPKFYNLSFQSFMEQMAQNEYDYFKVATETMDEYEMLQGMGRLNVVPIPPPKHVNKQRTTITLETSTLDSFRDWLNLKFPDEGSAWRRLFKLGKKYLGG